MTTNTATMTIIAPNGERTVTYHDPDKVPEYEVLRDAVGGLIQSCDAFMEDENARAFCNEEFLLLGFEPNLEGSKAVNWPVGKMDLMLGTKVGPLHGNVVLLLGFNDPDGENEDDDE